MNIKRLLAARTLLILAVFYTLFITTLSLVQLGKIAVGNFNPTDKMMHFAAYFVLAGLWKFYYLLKVNKITILGLLKIAFLMVIFGMFIELLQGVLTRHRDPEWADILANTFGIFVAFLFFSIFRKFLKRLKHKINLFL